jgi:hypothetical protein
MKYQLNLPLHFTIDPENSTYEFISVGRLYVNMAKKSKPNKWPFLLTSYEVQKQYNNIHTWWEIYEKHQYELNGYAKTEDYEDYKLDEELKM